MPSLVIPESGIELGSSADSPSTPRSAVPDVFGLTLSDGVIEEMIKCFQNGKPIQLSLGEHPSLSYGTTTQNLSTSTDPFSHELYRSEDSSPSTSKMAGKNIRVPHKVNTQFLAQFGVKKFLPHGKPAPTVPVPKETSTTTTHVDPVTSGTDAALQQLQSSLASASLKKQENTIKYFKDGISPASGRKGAAGKLGNKTQFLTSGRSMPGSPALSGVGSPSLAATSVPLSQQQSEQAKESRKPAIHLLAIEPMTERTLREAIPEVTKDELKQVLQRVAFLNSETSKWELEKKYYKELDVWSYHYSNDEDRQRAIDNAVRSYDRQRLGISEPEWDRLLPKAERGTGKCLSKVQAQIAQGPIQRAPKIKVQKDEGSGRETSVEVDSSEKPAPKVAKKVEKAEKAPKAEKKITAKAQTPVPKVKKIAEKSEKDKRWLSKTKPKAAAATGAKVLSSEYVGDSDDEDSTPAPAPKSKPAPVKRSREEEEATSDSSVPLSKKFKKEIPNHRISDASQASSRTVATASTSSISTTKTKNTSPQKSSPLASSPPTNVSEFESSSRGRTSGSSSASPAHHPVLKGGSRSPIHKRHHKSSSVTSSTSSGSSSRYLKPEVVDLARKYRSFYPKYEALHRELAGLKFRNSEKEGRLLDMHERLAAMKRDIKAGIVEVN